MRSLRILFAAACVASLAMASSANAATILIFGQANTSTDVVTATNSGGTTNFFTGPAPGAPITVDVTNIGGGTPPPGSTLPETFNFTSTAAVTGSAGNFTQGGFSGTFSFGAQVVGSITGGVLTTLTGPNGTTGSLLATNVSFTTLGPAILAQLGFPPLGPTPAGIGGTLSISLNGFVPSVPGTLNFTAKNAGLVDASVIPEPASVVLASISVIAGLGCYGLRRVKASA